MPSLEYLERLTSLTTKPCEVPHASGDTQTTVQQSVRKMGVWKGPPGPVHGQAQPGSLMHHPVNGQEAVLGTCTPPKNLPGVAQSSVGHKSYPQEWWLGPTFGNSQPTAGSKLHVLSAKHRDTYGWDTEYRRLQINLSKHHTCRLANTTIQCTF